MPANSPIYLPYDDYAQSANTLFHFMKKQEYLNSILRRGAIIPRYCVETIDYLSIQNGTHLFNEVAILQKCFCDIAFLLGENKHTLNFKVQFEKAKSIREVADSFSIAAALLAHLYNREDNIPSEDGNISLSDIKEYFRRYKSFFNRLSAIESKLAISISPGLLNALSLEEQQDIDELYLLLCEKKVVRLSAKLTSTSSTAVTMNNAEASLSIGDKIALTFIGSIEFSFLKQSVTLHTANLLINALVKDIQKCDDGTVRVLYGDTDSKPMYISFSAFQTSEEAKQESETIMQHESIYVNALTSNAYITQYYEEQ